MKKIFLLFAASFYVGISIAQVSDADKNNAFQLINANISSLGFSADDLNNLKISSSYKDNTSGVRYVYLQQTYKGIPVYNQMQVITFRNDKLLSITGDRINEVGQKVNISEGIPTVSAESAVKTAISDRKLTSILVAVPINSKDNGKFIEFGNMGVSRENITAQLMWVPDYKNKFLILAWQVYIIPTTSSDYWLVKIDATANRFLGVDNLTVYCNWDDPNHIQANEMAKNVVGKNQFFDIKTISKKTGKSATGPALADNVDYRVIPFPYEAPTFMPGPSTSWHAIRSNPWAAGSANATTLKWHSTATGTNYSYTRGNNVWAYHDRTNLNTGDSARSATSSTPLPNLTFDFTPDYTLEPIVTTPPNQQFNITNLFYWNNIIHDVLYNYGFDEAGGNFQNNNLGRGGLGSDHVRAEAQDGGGTNNANFSTPVDGSPPRMQMYLWVTPTPDRDGDVDNGVIIHEYGHGISNRLAGGPGNTSCLGNAEQMGEGWSDYFALMFTQDWVNSNLNTGFTNPRGIGTYANNQSPTGSGIRTQKYCTDFTINNRVYAASLSTSPHNRGEIWCATLWDMTWNIIQQNGVINSNIYDFPGGGGNTIAMKLVMEGLKLQQCSPGFIDGRNAILQADINLYGGTYQCVIKEAFRRRGMGEGASQGSSSSVTDQVPSFVSSGATLTLLQNGITSTPEGQNINYTNRLVNGNCEALTNYLITDTLPTNITFISATNGGIYNAGNRVVSWTVNQATGTSVDYNFVVNINTGAYFPSQTLLNEPVPASMPASWIAITTVPSGGTLWTVSTLESQSAPNSFFCSNETLATDKRLELTSSILLPASNGLVLSFWHRFNTEASWDGGVVEISTNGGSSWIDLGTFMTTNGYNGGLGAGTGNNLSNRAAFTGYIPSFINTSLNLASFASQSIKVRFRFASDDNTTAPSPPEGWFVDDILLQNIAKVDMRSSLFNASLIRVQYSDSTMIITAPAGCSAGTISGTSPLCIGATATYTSNGTSGGSWSSTNTSVATVASSTGVVTALAAGTTNITYTVTAGCGSPVSAFKTLTVDPNVTAGTVSGTSPLCIGVTANYTSNGTSGGSWSSNNTSVATVNSSTGLVTALSAGTTNITYTVSSGCGSPVSAFKTLIVSPNVTAGTVSGTSPLCIGTTSTYTSNGTSGGSWSSNNTSVATVNSSTGLVTALSAGTTNITYTVSSGCGSPVSAFKTLIVSLNVTAGTVSGTSPLCIGTTSTYTSNGTSGGSWGSSNTSVATVVAGTGVVTALAAGTTNITYTVNSGCGSPVSAFKTLAVDPSVTAGTVNGVSPLCISSTTTYSSTGSTGGSWSSTNTSVATVVAGTGVVTAVGAGTANITYTISSGCGSPVSSSMMLTVPASCVIPVIQGSVKKNADPTKIDIVFKSNYTSSPGEYINYLQFSLAIPFGVSAGVTATATGVNTFSNMGSLSPIPPYTQGTERIYGWAFAVPSIATQSWTNGVGFTGVEVAFSTTGAASVGKMVDFTNSGGGSNSNTYFAIVSTTGDVTNYIDFFYSIPAVSQLGTYPNNDQFVQTIATPLINDDAPGAILLTVGSGCTGSPFTNAGAIQSTGEPFAACKGIAGYKTVWYKFLAPASGNVRISSDYSGGTMGNDSRLALFSTEDVNNYAAFTSLACDDDNGVNISDKSILYATGLTPGNTYYVQVDGKDGSTATGTFCLTVDEMTSSMLSASTACAAGQPLTSANDNYTGWLSSTDASGKLIALLNNPSGGTTTSTYTNAMNINAGPVRQDPVSFQNYLDRNYFINNAAVSNVNVQFFFLTSELTLLQAIDPVVTLANLQVTRQTGTVCDNNFIAANGTNSSLSQTSNGTGTGFNWIQITTPGFSKFCLHTRKSFVPVKTFLQGAYNTSVLRHKDVTSTWAAVLNANALSQPYSISPFNYTGTETVAPGFFTSTAGTTDIVDWVLLELRDATTPSTLITRRAAFIREDGKIVDLNGVSEVAFRNVTNGSYHLVIRHRNHLLIRTATVRTLNGTMGFAVPGVFDFSSAQAQAYQDGAITSNAAQKDFGGGIFGMWGGNANSNSTVRASGTLALNDYLFLITTTLGGNVTLIINNVYNNADMNIDGTVRASGIPAQNDYLFLITTVLAGDGTKIIAQHQ